MDFSAILKETLRREAMIKIHYPREVRKKMREYKVKVKKKESLNML